VTYVELPSLVSQSMQIEKSVQKFIILVEQTMKHALTNWQTDKETLFIFIWMSSDYMESNYRWWQAELKTLSEQGTAELNREDGIAVSGAETKSSHAQAPFIKRWPQGDVRRHNRSPAVSKLMPRSRELEIIRDCPWDSDSALPRNHQLLMSN
jgi:hypothetical protein